jgi:hypothetical protein
VLRRAGAARVQVIDQKQVGRREVVNIDPR